MIRVTMLTISAVLYLTTGPCFSAEGDTPEKPQVDFRHVSVISRVIDGLRADAPASESRNLKVERMEDALGSQAPGVIHYKVLISDKNSGVHLARMNIEVGDTTAKVVSVQYAVIEGKSSK